MILTIQVVLDLYFENSVNLGRRERPKHYIYTSFSHSTVVYQGKGHKGPTNLNEVVGIICTKEEENKALL